MFFERNKMKEDILKLALEALDHKKSEIEKEIAEIRAELNGADPNKNQSRRRKEADQPEAESRLGKEESSCREKIESWLIGHL
jgi:hypothetical protein